MLLILSTTSKILDRHIYALAILDNGFGGQAGDGECHGDAVIHMAMDLGARKREASFDDHAVIGRGYVTAHSLKVFSDYQRSGRSPLPSVRQHP